MVGDLGRDVTFPGGRAAKCPRGQVRLGVSRAFGPRVHQSGNPSMLNTDERQAGRNLVPQIKYLALLFALASVFPLQAAAAGGEPALFRTVKALESSATGPRHQIEISREAAQAAARSGRLPVVMPDGSRFEAEVIRTETSAKGVWTLVARVDTGLGWQSAVISFGEGATFGALPTPSGGVMRIATSHGRSVIERDAPLRPAAAAKAGNESLDFVRPPPPKAGDDGVPRLADAESLAIAKSGPVTIDVLGVYTTELVEARGSVAAAETEFTNLLAAANQAYLDSGTVVRLNLVGFRQTNYGFDYSNSDALYAIRTNQLHDELDIWAERDATGADLVAMLRSYNGGSSCGVGYLNGGGGYAEQPQPAYGYSVSNADDCSLYTLAHEIGHNLGSTHDRENSDHGDGAYLFSHGYRQPGPPAFSTVMAYRAGAWQERIGYFSQPGTSLCKGVGCGVAEQSDNVRSLGLMAPRIALFRTPANTVAIHDSGVIEPNGASGTMWHLVQLSSPAGPGGVMVRVSTADGTATAGQDYLTRTDFVRIQEGQTTGYFTVQALGDDVQEADETVLVNIVEVTSPVPLTVIRGQGTGHIKSPALTVEDVLVAEGDAGTTVARFRLVLSQALTAPVVFDIATVSGSAVAGSDYVSRSLTGQQIPAGETEYLFDVEVATDLIPEPHESFQIQLANVSGALLPIASAHGRIFNDDYQLSVADVTLVEGNGGWTSMTVPIRLSSAATEAVRFNVDLGAGLATDGVDFDQRTVCSPCTLQAGQTELSYTVWINGDQADESDEHFTVTLSGAEGARLGKAQATVFIDDDDGGTDLPLLVVGDLSVAEGNAGSTPAPVVVALSVPAPAGGVSFDIATSNGTATAGSDYQARSLTAQTIAAGQRSATVNVQVTGDTTVEPDETFNVTVANVAGAVLADGQSVVTVHADDFLMPELTVSDVSVAEGDFDSQTVAFTVQLSGPAPAPVRFDAATSDGTATAGNADLGYDYLPLDEAGYTIGVGGTSATVSVTVHGDLAVEEDETFTLSLANITGAVVVDAEAAGEIRNDDSAPPLLRGRDDRIVLAENSPAMAVDVLANDIFDPARLAGGRIYLFQPTHGQVTLINNNTATAADDRVLFTPFPNYGGDTKFSYMLCETGDVRCTDASVRVVMRPVLDVATGTDTGAGFVDVTAERLRAMPDAAFKTTRLVAPVVSRHDLPLDATPEDAWDDDRAGSAYINRTISEAEDNGYREWRIVVDVHGLAGDVDVYVGTHSDSDGVPEAFEAECVAAMSTVGERCEMTMVFYGAADQRYWVLVHNRHTGAQTAQVEIFEVPLDEPSDGTLVATGPRILAADESFPIRLAWNDSGWLPGHSRLGFVEVQGGEGVWGMFPVRIDRTGSVSPALALTDAPLDLRLAAGAAQDRLFIDVPAGASALTVTTASAQNIDLYLAHDPTPSSPGIDPAPARSAAQASAVGATGNESLTISGAQLTPGRWYVTPVNADASSASVSVQATVTGAAPVVRPGSYFNAARAGHGLLMYPAGDSIAGLWYTYLQDGSPTWYYLQGLKPGSNGIWKASLYRAAWSGSVNTLTVIGEASVTPSGPDAFQFTYRLDGETGSEPLTAFGRGCPVLSGAALDVSSHWFNPARPGPGYSVQMFQDYEFYAAFVFDGRGVPRYLLAESSTFAGTETTLDLEQMTGFCPLCTRTGNPLRTDVGTFTRRYSGGSFANIGMDAIYANGVPGVWTSDESVQSLGGAGTTQGCEP